MNNLENRRAVIILIFLSLGVLFTGRLLYMQVFTEKWKLRSEQISEFKIHTYPSRGIIYDRKGEKLVENKTYYDLMARGSQMKSFDTTSLARLLGIPREDLVKKAKFARVKSYYIPYEIVKQIPADQFEIISEQLYKFPGFFGQDRTMRGYRYEIAAHLLGSIREVDSGDIKRNTYYRARDYIGSGGMEQAYEPYLRGIRGVQYLLKDAIGEESGKYANGKYDTLPIPGKNLYCTVDIALQEFGEYLMKNKIGSVVAIEPATGEILCMVSAPSYNPSLFVGRERGKNYMALNADDSLFPLVNRPINAYYPPGSVFKLTQALTGLQEGVIDINTGFPCNKTLVGCHNHPSAGNIYSAIQMSCNPYFFKCGQRIIQQQKSKNFYKDSEIGMGVWEKYMKSFGFGVKLETDVPDIKPGYIPDAPFYNRYHGEGRWAFNSIYSIAIGQGEVTVIPLQLANFAAIIANRGHYVTPHFIKGITTSGNIPKEYKKRNYSMVDSIHFLPVVEAMRRAVNEPGGTGLAAAVKDIVVCGKTGTAQNPHGEDHSVFIAFAPMDNPKIAMIVYVENGGWGGTYAAPIAGMLIEKYLTGTVKDSMRAVRMSETNLLDRNVQRTNTGGLKQHQKSKRKKGR